MKKSKLRKMVKDLGKAKRLVDRHLSVPFLQTEDDVLYYELYDTARTLESILDRLERRGGEHGKHEE